MSRYNFYKWIQLSLFVVLFCFPYSLYAQEAEIMTFEKFEQEYINGNQDTLYILNFWATWCAPCVKELPHFERASIEYRDKPVKVVLVSLDFVDQMESRLKPFIHNKKIRSKVVLLNAPFENIWIPKIDEQWTGAIPATLIIHPKKEFKNFYEGSYTWEELNKEISNHLN